VYNHRVALLKALRPESLIVGIVLWNAAVLMCVTLNGRFGPFGRWPAAALASITCVGAAIAAGSIAFSTAVQWVVLRSQANLLGVESDATSMAIVFGVLAVAFFRTARNLREQHRATTS
jgi:hypothetical protein